MNASHARPATPHAGHYYVPQPSLYPFILSGGMFLLALGFIVYFSYGYRHALAGGRHAVVEAPGGDDGSSVPYGG